MFAKLVLVSYLILAGLLVANAIHHGIRGLFLGAGLEAMLALGTVLIAVRVWSKNHLKPNT